VASVGRSPDSGHQVLPEGDLRVGRHCTKLHLARCDGLAQWQRAPRVGVAARRRGAHNLAGLGIPNGLQPEYASASDGWCVLRGKAEAPRLLLAGLHQRLPE